MWRITLESKGLFYSLFLSPLHSQLQHSSFVQSDGSTDIGASYPIHNMAYWNISENLSALNDNVGAFIDAQWTYHKKTVTVFGGTHRVCCPSATIYAERGAKSANEMTTGLFNNNSKSSRVSSAFDEKDAYDRVASYTPRDRVDQAREVLIGFLRFIPAGGKGVLAEFIVMLDDTEPHGLYIHLLIPSEIHFTIELILITDISLVKATPLPFYEYLSESKCAALSEQTLTERELERLKEICLARGNYHCTATGLVERSKHLCHAEFVHIIPFSMGYYEDQGVL